MPDKATHVDEYIAAAPPDRRAALELLRQLCRKELPGFEETIAHGMPSYRRAGVIEVAFASQKRYLSLYILRTAAMTSAAAELSGLSVGKGCIRYPRPDLIDPATVRDLLRATARDDGPVC